MHPRPSWLLARACSPFPFYLAPTNPLRGSRLAPLSLPLTLLPSLLSPPFSPRSFVSLFCFVVVVHVVRVGQNFYSWQVGFCRVSQTLMYGLKFSLSLALALITTNMQERVVLIQPSYSA